MCALPFSALLGAPVLLSAVLALAACGSSNGTNGFSAPDDGGTTGSDATADTGGGSGDGGMLLGNGGLGTATSLAITPANSTLSVTSLTTLPTETLSARVT